MDYNVPLSFIKPPEGTDYSRSSQTIAHHLGKKQMQLYAKITCRWILGLNVKIKLLEERQMLKIILDQRKKRLTDSTTFKKSRINQEQNF